ncbi:MAG: DNA-binding protein [Sphingobacteriaceae bacterium]|jgi:hypothetical protein|nr:DNA-binding protein [Sphingobacteriaceae bacterium]
MSKIKIDKNDAVRVLLSETLPYEVPILFSNEGFYQIIKNGEFEEFKENLKGKKKPYGIPFNYLISKSSDGSTRRLSVIHPFNQVDFIDFYEKYHSIIIHLCSKSQFSLRRITSVAKFSYSPDLLFEDDEHRSDGVETEPEALDINSTRYKSYFIYNPVDLIYKFYERNEYQRLEQRFKYLWEFDISKCFYHIYTHSITWAIKDKETAKRNATLHTFENKFDKLMQLSNYNETNGIVVGPEISRIFAEVILQQVDVNVLNRLNELKLKLGVDYEIRRYIDDFFVFSNNEAVLEEIFVIYKKELEKFKLYINSNKTKKSSTPLFTDISVAKRQVTKLVKSFFIDLVKISESHIFIDEIKNPYFVSKNFIKDFQSIIRQNGVSYDAANKDVVRFFKSEITKIFKRTDLKKTHPNYEGFLLAVLDIVFYCYSLSINASSTFKLAQLIVIVSKFATHQTSDIKHSILSKIFRECEDVMTIYHRKLKDKETNIEILNLIIPLKMLGEGYHITEKKLREYFDLEVELKDEGSNVDRLRKFLNLNYFHIITLLYYIDNDNQYENLKIYLEKSVVKKFETDEHPFSKSEMTCLFFDFIACPFVTMDSKRKVVIHSKYAPQVPALVAQAIEKIEQQKKWFMDWGSDIDLERVLKKKEWSTTY